MLGKQVKNRAWLLALAVLAFVLAALACGKTASPTPTPYPTFTPYPTYTPYPTFTPEPTATLTPIPTLGETWTRLADGMVMVYVPAGEFLMGSSDADGGADDDEKPQRTVYLDRYWIDRTEVTNAQYRKCVEAGACPQPRCWDESKYSAPDQPVVCVNWDDAQAYAAWAGGQLPSEAEWEKAARGTDGRIYPWRDTFDGSRLNYCDRNCAGDWADTNADDGYAVAAPVGSYLSGASPYGVLDMAGNVLEWTSSLYWPYPYRSDDGREDPEAEGERVLRGNAWLSSWRNVRCADRFGVIPGLFGSSVGFRLVVSHPPE